MSQETKTTHNNRKKTVLVGIICAVLGVALGVVITLAGAFDFIGNNTMNEYSNLSLSKTIKWDMPDGTKVSEDSSVSKDNSERIYFVGQRNKYIDLSVVDYNEWKSYTPYSISSYDKSKSNNNTVYTLKDDNGYPIETVVLSPDEQSVVTISMTDDSIDYNNMTEKEIKEWEDDTKEIIDNLVDSIEWK